MPTAKSSAAVLFAGLFCIGASTGNFNAIAAPLTVTKAGSGTGTVTGNTAALDCGMATCSDTFTDGTLITLTATPGGGSQFTGWLGPCTGLAVCQFTISGATTAVATFASPAIGGPVLDIDEAASCDALTDGLLIIRYLFGLSGADLTTGVVAPNAGRATDAAIGNYLIDIQPLLDITGNGVADALSDGLMILRYLFGLRGASLTAGAMGSGATISDIEGQIGRLCAATYAGPGEFCDNQLACAAGLTCADNVCCTSVCDGGCERCDVSGLAGTCSPVPNGQDPDAECGAVSCAGYYDGWQGDTCYQTADVSGAEASCNGARSCHTPAQECAAQTASGPAQLSCDSLCQNPNVNTCAGTIAGTCINLNPGNATCGSGACQITAPLCLNGAPNACVPNAGAATTESCNGIDDNCDGTIDNGSFADNTEINNDCTNYRVLPQIGSDQTSSQTALTLYPAGDVDYYRINAVESDSSCGCGVFSNDEDYELTVTLTVPQGAGSYTFCSNTACGTVGSFCQTISAGTSGQWTYMLDGACGSTDSYAIYVRVAAGNAPGFQCLPYTLTYNFDAGLCR